MYNDSNHATEENQALFILSPLDVNHMKALHLDDIISMYSDDPVINVEASRTAAIDLLTDIMHYCHTRNIDFARVREIADDHFKAEVNER